MEAICNMDCLCAHCDNPETCSNTECERGCTNGSMVRSHCADFMTRRSASDE